MRRLLSLLLLSSGLSFAQIPIGGASGGSGGGSFVFNGVLASIPPTCTVGDLAFITNASAGQNIYECSATNTWTQQLNSGAGGANAALSNLASVSINLNLLPSAAAVRTLGSATLPFSSLFFGSGANQSVQLTGTFTGNRLVFFPDSASATGVNKAAIANNFLTAFDAATGLFSAAQPAASNITGLAASATTDTTVATNITSGTLPAARLPNPSATTLGGIQSLASVASKWINTISTSGVPSATQPAASDVTGLAASATTDTTVADNITSGTLPAARLPVPSATTLGGIQSLAPVTSKWINTISTSGVPSATQPAASDITGLAASATTDTTVATNISSGTLNTARLPSDTVKTGQSNVFTTGTQDARSAVHTLPAVTGLLSAIPATCTVGELYFATDASSGQNIYECAATNTWTQQLIGAVGSVFGRSGDVSAQSGDYSFSQISGTAALTQVDSTLARFLGGSTIPSLCTPDQGLWRDPTLFEFWGCSATNTWVKFLTTPANGVWGQTVTYGTDPCGTVPAGSDCISVNGSQVLTVKQSTGTVKTVVDSATSCGGDLAGTYPNCDVAKLAGLAASTVKAHGFGVHFDGQGSTIAVNSLSGTKEIVYACTIAGWNISADTGTITIDVAKIATGTAIPVFPTNSITASATPALATGNNLRSTTLTGWGTTVTVHDLVRFKVTAVSGATSADLDVECNQ